ncbi:MAG: hypothetical protein U0X20_17260 [Caldilineaceae bacterium]
MPKGNATKLAYKLHVKDDGTFQEMGTQLMRNEVVLEIADEAIATLESARQAKATRDVFLDAHNQRGIAAIRAYFTQNPTAGPQPVPQPTESDS